MHGEAPQSLFKSCTAAAAATSLNIVQPDMREIERALRIRGTWEVRDEFLKIETS